MCIISYAGSSLAPMYVKSIRWGWL